MKHINRTKQYPFDAMQVGDSFLVTDRLQHARVAASEHARRHNQCFTCRVQDDGSMRVYRIERSQQVIDNRGRNGQRHIPSNGHHEPTQAEFNQWLDTLPQGTVFNMTQVYSNQFDTMIAWCQSYSTALRIVLATKYSDELVIVKIA